MKLEIRTANVHVDGGSLPKADFEILLRFVCDIVVRVAGIEVFREVEFPFVEFGSQVAEWLATGCADDFDFESMDSAVRGLVYFHRTEDEQWRIGSTLPGSPPARAVTKDELREGLDGFLASVPAAADAFGVDVRRFIEWGRREEADRGS